MTTDRQLVPHAGGKVTLSPAGSSWYKLRFEMSSLHGGAMYQVAISRNGTPLAVVPVDGIGSMRPYPQPSILAFVISDQDMMWGRKCPHCQGYFRTDHTYGFTSCPYCMFEADSLWFLTESQLSYLRKFVDVVDRVINEQAEVEINFDDVTDAAEWSYAEQQLQHRFLCPTCNVTTDILGEYGSCPKCGKRNSAKIFHRKLNEIESQIAAADQVRRVDLLNNTVATFEAMANDLKKVLIPLPARPERKKQIERVNFQDIISSVQQLETWLAFDLDTGLTVEDLAFVNLMFKRRHLLVHNAARVDQKYLDETGDKKFDLHETIAIEADDLKRLLPLVRALGASLIRNTDEIA